MIILLYIYLYILVYVYIHLYIIVYIYGAVVTCGLAGLALDRAAAGTCLPFHNFMCSTKWIKVKQKKKNTSGGSVIVTCGLVGLA